MAGSFGDSLLSIVGAVLVACSVACVERGKGNEMLAKLLGCLGLNSTEDVIEFFICGLAVLPAMLFLSGERNAAAVVILLLINGLLIYGMRAREMENLREAEELARKQNPAEDSKPPAES